MAHIKAGAVTKGNRDSKAKRLGVKMFAGQKVITGNILVRQKGTKFYAGIGTKMGGDYTIFATTNGILGFLTRLGRRFLTVSG